MFWTFFSLKCGTSDFLALRAEVRWPKSLANRSLWNIDVIVSTGTVYPTCKWSADNSFHLCTCLYVLSATLSRKKKSQIRQTRTRKLSVTMVITRTSEPDPHPSATDRSSLAERVVNWSKSRYWASLHRKEGRRSENNKFKFLSYYIFKNDTLLNCFGYM